jgi:hypothetical protein
MKKTGKNAFLIWAFTVGILSCLKAQNVAYRNLFDDTRVTSLYITMREDSLVWLFQNVTFDSSLACTFVFDDGVKRDTLTHVGFRLRGNTSRSSRKKSFKFKFNAFNQKGRKYQGVKEINLNGSHNDPTMIREKLFYDVWNRFGLPPRRAAFSRVYINGIYYGLYTLLEELDDEWLDEISGNSEGNLYKCTYPADLKYINRSEASYKTLMSSSATGGRVYDLKNNEALDNYADLVQLITAGGNSADAVFNCEIEKNLDVEMFLKAYAVEIMCGHWDDFAFNKNNFYLYNDPLSLTGRFKFISYDADNTFGVDWVNQNWTTRPIFTWHSATNAPLVARIMAKSEYRKSLNVYCNQLISIVLQNLEPRIDSLRTLISPAASNDVYRTFDYGFTYAQFLSNFDSSQMNQAKFGIKQFIKRRIATARAQMLQPIAQKPMISAVDVQPRLPQNGDSILFKIQVFNHQTTAAVSVQVSPDSVNFENYTLLDDGNHADGAANDGVFALKIRRANPSPQIWYRFSAQSAEGTSLMPLCGALKLRFGRSTAFGKLFINEFLADNTTVRDPFGEFDDYLEIYNGSSEPLYLGDKYLSDNYSNPTKWKLPAENIAPRTWKLYWLDNQGWQGENHGSFALAAGGEQVALFGSVAEGYGFIDSFRFGRQQPNVSMGYFPDGSGRILPLGSRTPGATNVVVSVAPTPVASKARLYPNPVQKGGTFRLLSAAQTADLPAKFNVGFYSSTGIQVRTVSNVSKTSAVSTEGLAAGLYLLNVQVESKTVFLGKIVVLE